MKPDHRDYEFSTKVLNSMDGKGLMALHDKLHRTPYHKLKNTKNTRSEIQNRILNKAFNYSEIYDNFNEAKDPKEYGFEGEMAMSQLKGIMQHAKQLHGMLKPDTDLPEWVQSKITLAYDYMQTAADYTATEMSEEAPVNSVGDGKIAGMGVGPQGEPGVKPDAMKKYKDKNAAEAPKAGRRSFSMFMQGK